MSRHPHALISLARLRAASDYHYLHALAVSALMIALARQFEMQMKLLQTAESNEQRAAQLLSMNA